MNRIRRIDEPVQRLFCHCPATVHAQKHHSGTRRRDVDQVADALHVRLAGEDPEVADEDIADGDRVDLVAHLHLADDPVRASHRHAGELGLGLVEHRSWRLRCPTPGSRSTTLPSLTDPSRTIGMSALPFWSRW